jgi:hypothetical protein
MVDGVPGGRSTYGECFGVLSWAIDEGRYGELELSGLAVALVTRYHDDEPGSPWTIVLHVDERASDEQRDALAAIFLGRAGGDHVLKLPWNRKPSTLVAIRPSPIELAADEEGHVLRVGRVVRLQATKPVETTATVACIMPGYDVPGTELYADELVVDDEPFSWELHGKCAFAAPFTYRG